MITGSPTAERLNTGIKGKRGDRARRQSTNRGLRVMTTKRTDILTFRVKGTHTADSTIPGPMSLTKKVELPTVVTVQTRTVKKPGRRIHKAAQSLPYDQAFFSVPKYATKVLPSKATTAAKGERKPPKDKDGCAYIRVSDPVQGRKNKHTVDPGPSQVGTFGKVSNGNDWELVSLELEPIGKTKRFMAKAIFRNPVARLKKCVTVPRVRNEKEALIALCTINGIDIT